MFRYNQATGEIWIKSSLLGAGYSGHGDGRNNPLAEAAPFEGPTPKGLYKISEAFDQIPGKGPCIMHLTPETGTNTFGRSGFMIHGNNARNDASEGCIILGPAIRRQIADSDDKQLEVY